MTIWETDNEYLRGPAATSHLKRHEAPYRTPSRGSRKSRRSVTPPGKKTATPPPPHDRGDRGSKRSSRDITTDESISILDPRRFTPTLHANLVSEILSLRRDQDEKIKLIESLETSLHSSKQEKESLQEELTIINKEGRSLKRQLTLLEGGSSSAIGELAKERDEAVDTLTETKKRLEAAQKKIRTQEDDSTRVHDLWAEEKDGWEEERRKYERKIHIAESRLRLVLDEVAAYQESLENGHGNVNYQGHDSDAEESGKEDVMSVRSMSLTESVRYSLLGRPEFAKPANGNTLADELNFDTTTDDDMTDIDGRGSVLSNYSTPKRHTRNLSRESILNRLHQRNQSWGSPTKRPGSVARGRIFIDQALPETLEGCDEEPQSPMPKPTYMDTGIQYSPPPSPKLAPIQLVYTEAPALPAKALERESALPRNDKEIEANQRRKRVSRPLPLEPTTTRLQMISAASQTMEMPLSPPKTPQTPCRPVTPPQASPVSMVTSSAQTDSQIILSPRSTPLPPSPLAPPPLVPSISVQPPASRPSTPKEPVLPQYFKHFGCQVNIPSAAVTTNDACVQTDTIKVDKRLALLPLHLQPSAISSRPTSPNPTTETEPDNHFTPVPGNVPPRNPRRLTAKYGFSDVPSSPTSNPSSDAPRDAYPGNNDDGPLSEQIAIRRPQRFSSLFAGFQDAISSDEVDEFGGDGDLSDSEFRTALSAPVPRSISSYAGKRSSTGTNTTVQTSPEQGRHRRGTGGSVRPFGADMFNSYSLAAEQDSITTKAVYKSPRALEKSPALHSNREGAMRKSALIQSGIASHHGRSRSPSVPEVINPPPFPIPTRASSKKPPQYGIKTPSDGLPSPTSSSFRGRGSRHSHYRTSSIRKSRSAAAAVPRHSRHRRRGSRSPPLSPSTEAPESPSIPLPSNDVTRPSTWDRSTYRRHRHRQSATTDNTNGEDVASHMGNTEKTSVVDAIAQTMVGEWMFKYVRRRKSFGMPEGSSKDDNSNDRHKRWVWLAPYERAILWSSKQPSSGTALMGKAGRKLAIQSVLDVKDDNPVPRGEGPLFDRSILILTPQRALKFTALNAERHYIWLTALSFLAHSTQAVPDVGSSLHPPVDAALEPEYRAPPPPAKVKRGKIRDSIRLAKGRPPARPRPAVPAIPSIPSMPSSQIGDVALFQVQESGDAVPAPHYTRDDSIDAAEPPMIQRFNDRSGPQVVHSRKRSNTGNHAPPLSFRGFSSPIGSTHAPSNSTAGVSINTADSSDVFQSQTSSNKTWAMSQTASERTSEASSRPSNFFDAIGTVRMEAFISPLAFSQVNDYPDEPEELRQVIRRRSKDSRRRRYSRSRHDSYNSRFTRDTDEYNGGYKTTGEEDFFREDPFRGF